MEREGEAMDARRIGTKAGVAEEIGLCVIEEQASYPKVGERPSR